MDHFRIKQFQNIAEIRCAEHKLKELDIPVVLTGSHELYVPIEHLNRSIEALDLPPEVKNERQPGPWCPRCGHQLVSKKGRFSSISWRVASLRSWYCHGCNDEIRDISTIDRLRRKIKRNLVRRGYYSKPAFLIIGAQKAGTSAMFQILQQHPQIVAPREKELRFFDDYPKMKYGDFLSYHEMYPLPYQLKPDRLTFEASPSYLFNPVCARRIYQYSPSIRLIISLRDPISRAFSAWKMHQRFAQSTNQDIRLLGDTRSFEDAIKQEVKMFEKTAWEKHLFAYIKRGIYVEQVERYMKYFSKDSLFFLEQSDLLPDPQAVFTDVFRFLQVDDQFVCKPLRVNVSMNNEEMSHEAKDILHSFYKPYNERLYALLGRTFAW